MGSSHSSERRQENPPPRQGQQPPNQPAYNNYPPPPVYNAPQYYQPAQQNNGQYYGQYQQNPYPVQYRPPAVPPPAYLAAAPPPYVPPQSQQSQSAPRAVQTQECQTTATIRNQVNLKKHTLKLEATGQPGVYQITFSFDASAPCRATTFVVAHEDAKRTCRITAQAPMAPAVPYGKGLEHKFPNSPAVAAQHVVNTTRFPAKDLTTVQPDTFPVIIRLEALTEEGVAAGRSLDSLEPGCELPLWVQSQTTYARLFKEDDGGWGLRVIKQKLWVKGTSYELQEIYGMEQNNKTALGTAAGSAAGGDGYDDGVDGNECVICMSAPRDTTALPCRHMCMCHGCASALKTQTNKCPICRNEIESLLHIKINKGNAPAAT